MKTLRAVCVGVILSVGGLSAAPLPEIAENWDSYALGTEADATYVATWETLAGANRFEVVAPTSTPNVFSAPNSLKIGKQVALGITRDLTPEIDAVVAGATEVAGTDASPLVVFFIVDLNTPSNTAADELKDIFVEVSRGDAHVDATSGTPKDVIAFGLTNGLLGPSLSPRFFDGQDWATVAEVVPGRRFNYFTVEIRTDTVVLTGAQNATGTATLARSYLGGFNRLTIRVVYNDHKQHTIDDVRISGGEVSGSGPTAPVVSSVDPSSGPAAGGTPVTVGGEGFAEGSEVFFGAEPATDVVVVSAAEITCVTPAHAEGAVTVEVRNPDTQSGALEAAYTFVAAPTVSAVDPVEGAASGGTAVTILGSGFAEGSEVFFGAEPATDVVVVSAAEITCVTPAHAEGAVTVEVTNLDGQTAALEAAFTYVTPPVTFWRGDHDGNGEIDISDPVATLGYLFLGDADPVCLDAVDVDDSGEVDLSDAVYSLSYQFLGEADPLPPFEECGEDPTPEDELDCAEFPPCSGAGIGEGGYPEDGMGYI